MSTVILKTFKRGKKAAGFSEDNYDKIKKIPTANIAE